MFSLLCYQQLHADKMSDQNVNVVSDNHLLEHMGEKHDLGDHKNNSEGSQISATCRHKLA